MSRKRRGLKVFRAGKKLVGLAGLAALAYALLEQNKKQQTRTEEEPIDVMSYPSQADLEHDEENNPLS